MPTLSPRAAKPSARLHDVVDLPTPPLADATAMICLTPGMPAGRDVARAFTSVADTSTLHVARPVAASLNRACSLRSGRVAFCRFTRPQIVVRGHRCRTVCGVRIETLGDDGCDTAVFAHF